MKKQIKKATLLGIILTMSVGLLSCIEGKPHITEKSPNLRHEQLHKWVGKPIKVTGTIRLVGNEPFTRWVITVKHRDVYLVDVPSDVNLQTLIGKKATASGSFHEKQKRIRKRSLTRYEYSIKVDSLHPHP